MPDAEVDAQRGQIRQRFQTEDAFKNMLTQQKLTMEQVRAETRNEISVSKLLEAEIRAEDRGHAGRGVCVLQREPTTVSGSGTGACQPHSDYGAPQRGRVTSRPPRSRRRRHSEERPGG